MRKQGLAAFGLTLLLAACGGEGSGQGAQKQADQASVADSSAAEAIADPSRAAPDGETAISAEAEDSAASDAAPMWKSQMFASREN